MLPEAGLSAEVVGWWETKAGASGYFGTAPILFY